MRKPIKVVIIDRDGVINLNSKDPDSDLYYITKPSNLILKDGTEEAFDMLADLSVHNDWRIVLATRQRCIEKGLVSYEEVQEINKKIDFKFDSIYIQSSGDDKTKTFKDILEDFNVSPEFVVVVDDSVSEIDAARKLGISTIHAATLSVAVNILSKYFEKEIQF